MCLISYVHTLTKDGASHGGRIVTSVHADNYRWLIRLAPAHPQVMQATVDKLADILCHAVTSSENAKRKRVLPKLPFDRANVAWK